MRQKLSGVGYSDTWLRSSACYVPWGLSDDREMRAVTGHRGLKARNERPRTISNAARARTSTVECMRLFIRTHSMTSPEDGGLELDSCWFSGPSAMSYHISAPRLRQKIDPFEYI